MLLNRLMYRLDNVRPDCRVYRADCPVCGAEQGFHFMILHDDIRKKNVLSFGCVNLCRHDKLMAALGLTRDQMVEDARTEDPSDAWIE